MVAEGVLTVHEVNARLPLVRAVVRDIVELHGDVAARRERIRPTSRSDAAGVRGKSMHDDEVRQVENELQRDEQRLLGYSDELLQIGGVLIDAATGTVDFPGVLGGDRVWLCWQYNEPAVMFWHSGPCGTSERMPIAAEIHGAACSASDTAHPGL